MSDEPKPLPDYVLATMAEIERSKAAGLPIVPVPPPDRTQENYLEWKRRRGL